MKMLQQQLQPSLNSNRTRLTRHERKKLIHGCGPETTPAMAASLTLQAEIKRLARLADSDRVERRKDDGMMRVLRAAGKL